MDILLVSAFYILNSILRWPCIRYSLKISIHSCIVAVAYQRGVCQHKMCFSEKESLLIWIFAKLSFWRIRLGTFMRTHISVLHFHGDAFSDFHPLRTHLLSLHLFRLQGGGSIFPWALSSCCKTQLPHPFYIPGRFSITRALEKGFTARNDLPFPRPMGTRCGGGFSYESSTFPTGVSWRTFPCMFTCAYVAFVIVSVPPLLFCLLLLTALEL